MTSNMAPSSSTLSFFDREIRNLLTADDDYTLPVDTIYKKARADYEKQPWLTSDGLALGVHCFSALFTSILLGPVLILFFLSLSEFLFKVCACRMFLNERRTYSNEL
jgi:hypothetical protein